MSSLVNGNPATGSQISPMSSAPAIEISGLMRRFGSTLAVDDVSFTVAPGEVFGFIGPNGAGKTTTMRILATLDEPDAGRALVDGFSVVDDPDRVRSRLGFMPDGFGTYANVTCEEYLDFFARSYGMRGNARLAALRNVMGFTQLDRISQKPVDGLSKGMKQRLCLGRALIHDPSVLILDEPAAGLDPRARIELREMITALAADGKSLLVSSHILTELAEMCDRVGIIEQGRLLAVGSVDEILNAPIVDGVDGGETGSAEATGLTITVLRDVEHLHSFLNQRFPDHKLRTFQQSIQFSSSLNDAEKVELLKSLVDAGLPVCGFATRGRSLEDAFLQVTRGSVQ